MGNNIPLPALEANNFMCITITLSDKITLFYAGRQEIDTVQQAIMTSWPKAIQNAQALFSSGNTVIPSNCYEFKLKGNPFSSSSEIEDAIATRNMTTIILHNLHNLGWKLVVSTHLSRHCDLTTWVFQKQMPNSHPNQFFNIGLSDKDKLQINDCPQPLIDSIKLVVLNVWTHGIQEEKRIEPSTYEIKLRSTPWSILEKQDSCNARYLLKQIIQMLANNGWLLYGNSNLSQTADTLFFQYDATLQRQDDFFGDDLFLTVSLNKDDRIRLIHVSDRVISTVDDVVRQNWSSGIQEIIDECPQCFEMKLRGNPWSASGDEAVRSRQLVMKIMERLASIGYYIITGLDVNRISKDKSSLLLFRRGVSLVTSFFCLSLHGNDKISLINAPQNVVDIAKPIFYQWMLGIQEEKQLFDGFSYQVKLKGNPWSTMSGGEGYHGRALLLSLLTKFASMCWRLVASADVSSKYISDDTGTDYPEDPHSWYFMYHQ